MSLHGECRGLGLEIQSVFFFCFFFLNPTYIQATPQQLQLFLPRSFHSWIKLEVNPVVDLHLRFLPAPLVQPRPGPEPTSRLCEPPPRPPVWETRESGRLPESGTRQRVPYRVSLGILWARNCLAVKCGYNAITHPSAKEPRPHPRRLLGQDKKGPLFFFIIWRSQHHPHPSCLEDEAQSNTG